MLYVIPENNLFATIVVVINKMDNLLQNLMQSIAPCFPTSKSRLNILYDDYRLNSVHFNVEFDFAKLI